jgi:hypothetical protein
VSSVRDLTELLKALRELRTAVDQFLRPVEELRSSLVEPVAKPIEDEFKKTLGSVLYSRLIDLGRAREPPNVDLEGLKERIKRHFS